VPFFVILWLVFSTHFNRFNNSFVRLYRLKSIQYQLYTKRTTLELLISGHGRCGIGRWSMSRTLTFHYIFNGMRSGFINSTGLNIFALSTNHTLQTVSGQFKYVNVFI
jgi:hypothetical protein